MSISVSSAPFVAIFVNVLAIFLDLVIHSILSIFIVWWDSFVASRSTISLRSVVWDGLETMLSERVESVKSVSGIPFSKFTM